MLMRLIDFLKSKQITAMFTSLTSGGNALEQSEVGVSSIMDTWLLLRDVELGGERNRVMYILKSRGMAHSNQLREFLLTDHGIELEDVYIGLDGVLTGSSRLAQEAREKAAATGAREEIEAKRRELERARQASEAQIAAIRLEYRGEGRRASPCHCPRGVPASNGSSRHEWKWAIREKRMSDGSQGPSSISSDQGEKTHEHHETRKLLLRPTEPPDQEERWELRLYVAGRTPKSVAAFVNLKRICEEHMKGRYHVEVIDLLGAAATGQGRPDSCRPHAGAETPRAVEEDHWRLVQRGAGAGRPGPAARESQVRT